MSDDDLSGDAEDGSSFDLPIHPDDRLWRHPSEVGRSLRQATTPAPVPPRRHRSTLVVLAVGLCSGLVASSLTVAALLAAGAFDSRNTNRIATPQANFRVFDATTMPAVYPTPSTEVATMARRVEPALARVEVTTAAGHLSGTAVAVRADGFFLTSADLLGHPDDVWLVLADNHRERATVVGVDRVTNLGVLRTEADKVSVPTWGDSSQVVAGADAVVVGASEPNARSASVAKGVVSAVGSRYILDNGTTLHDLIRTDANLTAGAVGGVLLDPNGSVVGIITTIGRDSSGVARIGFAMPIEYAKALADSYIVFGHPAPVWLGVIGTTLPKEQADGLAIPGGVLVDTVMPQSPAQLAAILPGDVIVAIDNTPVDTWSAMNLALRRLDPGDPLTLTLHRGSDTIQALTFVARPPQSFTNSQVQ
jgi:S1-C subfamily serine protease